MITQQLWGYGRSLAERFGAGWVIGCTALGCLLPIAVTGLMCFGLLLLLMEWR